MFIGLDLAPAASGCFALDERGAPWRELYVGTPSSDLIHKRIYDSFAQIESFLGSRSIPPTLTAVEDFAFASRFSSRDIAMHAGYIRTTLCQRSFPILLIPPTSMKSWVAEEGFPVNGKNQTIDWMKEKLEWTTEYRRKSEYNHVADAAALARMAFMAHQLFNGEDVGTPKQRAIFLTLEKNSKGMPKGLLHRPELLINYGS